MALRLFSLGITLAKAMREWSSTATWTYSQSTPRLLLWPLRSPGYDDRCY